MNAAQQQIFVLIKTLLSTFKWGCRNFEQHRIILIRINIPVTSRVRRVNQYCFIVFLDENRAYKF